MSSIDELPGPSLLFCPADRPERYAKAVMAADLVVIDLEDAVHEAKKDEARNQVAAIAGLGERIAIRVNGIESRHHTADLDAVRASGARLLMLPKAEHPQDLAGLAEWPVIALCETPLGVLNAPALAAVDNVVALMWGAEDLVAGLRGRSSRNPQDRYGDPARLARAHVLMAARALGKHAVDAVYLALDDPAGLAEEAATAADDGFDLKACVHPRQVPVVREAFNPSEEAIAHARRVLAAVGDADASGAHLHASTGVATVDGMMVDAPLIAQARRILRGLGR